MEMPEEVDEMPVEEAPDKTLEEENIEEETQTCFGET